MMTNEHFDRIMDTFPILQRASAQVIYEFQQNTFLASYPKSKEVFAEGGRASTLPLLLSGSILVYKTGKTGREITLYRLASGDSCTLTANAIINHQPFHANAVVEHAAEAVLVPEQVLCNWMARHSFWREYITQLLSQRINSVMDLVEDLVFRRMDERVATFLEQRSKEQHPIYVTHQEIASELGSSREVISRILEDFRAHGLTRSKRGEVEILDYKSLSALSAR
jgi:CRP/FNR family transcriptional regulator